MLAGEEQRRPLAGEVLLERAGVLVDLGLQSSIGFVVEQLDGSLEVVGACEQALPGVDL